MQPQPDGVLSSKPTAPKAANAIVTTLALGSIADRNWLPTVQDWRRYDSSTTVLMRSDLDPDTSSCMLVGQLPDRDVKGVWQRDLARIPYWGPVVVDANVVLRVLGVGGTGAVLTGIPAVVDADLVFSALGGTTAVLTRIPTGYAASAATAELVYIAPPIPHIQSATWVQNQRSLVQTRRVVSLAEARRRSIAVLGAAEQRREEAAEAEARAVEPFFNDF